MKKKKLFLIALLGLPFMACNSQNGSEGYILKGNIEGLPEGTHVQLVPMSHNDEKPIADTIVTNNGQFVFTGKTERPIAVMLLIKDTYGSRNLMLENRPIEISGKVTSKGENGSTIYNWESVTISGSPLSARYDSLMQVRNYTESLYEANAQKHAAFDRLMQEAYNAKDQTKIKELRESEAGKARAADDARFFHTVDSVYHKTVMDNKDSFWGPLMMISLTSYLDKNMASWYEALSPEAKNSYYGKMVKEEVYPAGKEGTKVQEFTVKDNNGKEITLSELCQGKKYILIDFWASWCNPCRKEIPNLKKLYAQYAEKGFSIISISIDKNKADWEKALKEENLPWNNFLDETGVADLYKVRFVPTMYLIDAKGIMVGENLRGEALANKLQELFQ